jgi:hypothetical protein
MKEKMILITTAVLSIICSLLGILTPIYSDIEWINAQVRGQDAITIAGALFLLFTLRFRQPAKGIVTAGISAYLVYTYFFYALEVQLNVLFFCYLAILLLSIILLVRSINFLRTTDTTVPKKSYRITGIIFMGIMALILTVLWSGDVIANLTGGLMVAGLPFDLFLAVFWAFLGTIGIVLAALYIRSLSLQARREAHQ